MAATAQRLTPDPRRMELLRGSAKWRTAALACLVWGLCCFPEACGQTSLRCHRTPWRQEQEGDQGGAFSNGKPRCSSPTRSPKGALSSSQSGCQGAPLERGAGDAGGAMGPIREGFPRRLPCRENKARKAPATHRGGDQGHGRGWEGGVDASPGSDFEWSAKSGRCGATHGGDRRLLGCTNWCRTTAGTWIPQRCCDGGTESAARRIAAPHAARGDDDAGSCNALVAVGTGGSSTGGPPLPYRCATARPCSICATAGSIAYHRAAWSWTSWWTTCRATWPFQWRSADASAWPSGIRCSFPCPGQCKSHSIPAESFASATPPCRGGPTAPCYSAGGAQISSNQGYTSPGYQIRFQKPSEAVDWQPGHPRQARCQTTGCSICVATLWWPSIHAAGRHGPTECPQHAAPASFGAHRRRPRPSHCRERAERPQLSVLRFLHSHGVRIYPIRQDRLSGHDMLDWNLGCSSLALSTPASQCLVDAGKADSFLKAMYMTRFFTPCTVLDVQQRGTLIVGVALPFNSHSALKSLGIRWALQEIGKQSLYADASCTASAIFHFQSGQHSSIFPYHGFHWPWIWAPSPLSLPWRADFVHHCALLYCATPFAQTVGLVNNSPFEFDTSAQCAWSFGCWLLFTPAGVRHVLFLSSTQCALSFGCWLECLTAIVHHLSALCTSIAHHYSVPNTCIGGSGAWTDVAGFPFDGLAPPSPFGLGPHPPSLLGYPCSLDVRTVAIFPT